MQVGESVKSVAMTKRVYTHCPPYLKPTEAEGKEYQQKIWDERPGAEGYYQILGRCQCLPNGEHKCTQTKMTYNKYMPWTRFPIAKNAEGKITYLNMGCWSNPCAERSPKDVKRHIDELMKQGIVNGVATWVPYYSDEQSEARPGKWPKFWFAVHVLYEWAQWRARVNDATLVKCIRAFWYAIDDLLGKDGAYATYVNAGLLHDATKVPRQGHIHAFLFREFRPDLNMSDEEKNELAHLLMTEKARAEMMFEKEVFLKSRVKCDKQNVTIDAWSRQEYDMALKGVVNNPPAQEDVALLYNFVAVTDKDGDEDEDEDDDDAVAAARLLSGMKGGGQEDVNDDLSDDDGVRKPGEKRPRKSNVNMLLNCLQRLNVEGNTG